MKKYLLVFITVFLFSCNSKKIDLIKYSEVQKKGNEISMLTQSTLLANVGKAIQKGGSEYAVEFCNLEAESIVDSLNLIHNCHISRVTEKNRNPGNKIEGKQELELWDLYLNELKNDTVVQTENKYVYYKPITIALPACLMCHGNVDAEINALTAKKIKSLYPNDLATGYQMNDFRGLWKIEFDQK